MKERKKEENRRREKVYVEMAIRRKEIKKKQMYVERETRRNERRSIGKNGSTKRKKMRGREKKKG